MPWKWLRWNTLNPRLAIAIEINQYRIDVLNEMQRSLLYAKLTNQYGPLVVMLLQIARLHLPCLLPCRAAMFDRDVFLQATTFQFRFGKSLAAMLTLPAAQNVHSSSTWMTISTAFITTSEWNFGQRRRTWSTRIWLNFKALAWKFYF